MPSHPVEPTEYTPTRRARSLNAETLNTAADSVDPERQALTELIAQHIDDLGPGETPLSRVTVSRHTDRETQYIVKDAAGGVVAVLSSGDLASQGSRAEAIRKAVARVTCSDCGTELIGKESGLCSPCEGKAIRELMELRDDLA